MRLPRVTRWMQDTFVALALRRIPPARMMERRCSRLETKRVSRRRCLPFVLCDLISLTAPRVTERYDIARNPFTSGPKACAYDPTRTLLFARVPLDQIRMYSCGNRQSIGKRKKELHCSRYTRTLGLIRRCQRSRHRRGVARRGVVIVSTR